MAEVSVIKDELSEKNIVSSQYDKVVELGRLTLKVTILINGGAVIALLALIGSILSTNKDLESVITFLTWAVVCFGFGVLSGAIAVAMGYSSQYDAYHSNHSYSLSKSNEVPVELLESFEEDGNKFRDSSIERLKNAKCFIYASLALFGIGIVFCALAFLCNFS